MRWRQAPGRRGCWGCCSTPRKNWKIWSAPLVGGEDLLLLFVFACQLSTPTAPLVGGEDLFFVVVACQLTSAPPTAPLVEGEDFFSFFFACQLSSAPPVKNRFQFPDPGTWMEVWRSIKLQNRIMTYLYVRGAVARKLHCWRSPDTLSYPVYRALSLRIPARLYLQRCFQNSHGIRNAVFESYYTATWGGVVWNGTYCLLSSGTWLTIKRSFIMTWNKVDEIVILLSSSSSLFLPAFLSFCKIITEIKCYSWSHIFTMIIIPTMFCLICIFIFVCSGSMNKCFWSLHSLQNLFKIGKEIPYRSRLSWLSSK